MFRLLRFFAALILVGGILGLLGAGAVLWYLVPRLPSIENLKDVRLQVPLRIYTRDGKLMAEFGEKRRIPLKLSQIPPTMVKAVIAAEDEHFYHHPGVDWQGIARAVLHLVRTGEKGPGGSTITMQVARNFFLGRQKTYTRKLNEILLALKIERELTKNEILDLYLNKIFLGNRAYGIGAAAHVYYGTDIQNLNLAQYAMLAGLPKAPSRFNPIADPQRAVSRRDYVLGRMRALGFIGEEAYQAALKAPVTASLHGLPIEVRAPYVAEMVRARMESLEGDDAYTGGYRVYTSVDSRLQGIADGALRDALVEYDRRHGYRGPEGHVANVGAAAALDSRLAGIPDIAGFVPGIVTAVAAKQITVHTRADGDLEIPWAGLSWARRYIDENRRGAAPRTASEVVKTGDIVRVEHTTEGWRLGQVPNVEGALVALDPHDGAIRALVGGLDFERSKFNRAVQAERQPGSAFKPFVYSAALHDGFTPASFINDAPVVFDDPSLEAAWRPENYSGKFFGPTRLREALVHSRNLVSIRLLQAIGIDYALDYARRFGLDPQKLPHNLSLALGTATLSPLQIARGYAVIANGGYLVNPYYIDRVVGPDGRVVMQADPVRVCTTCEQPAAPSKSGTLTAANAEPSAAAPVPAPASGAKPSDADRIRPAPRTISADNAWLMNSMMRDVIRRGTGRRALELKRKDLAGKTGTTNDQHDAWFSGFNPTLVATAWVGFDQVRPLGRHETGAHAALPMWMKFMGPALAGQPETFLEQPDDLVTVRIDANTGRPAEASDPNAIFETFPVARAPKRDNRGPAASDAHGNAPAPQQHVTEKLF